MGASWRKIKAEDCPCPKRKASGKRAEIETGPETSERCKGEKERCERADGAFMLFSERRKDLPPAESFVSFSFEREEKSRG